MFRIRVRSTRGFSLLEVLVALAILLAGIVTIVNVFPLILKAGQKAIHLREASLLAQQKAEEIRRDWRAAPYHTLSQIKFLSEPTEPIQSSLYPHLEYSFASVSLLDPVDDLDDVRDNRNVARVIVRYHPSYNPSEEVLYELRFDR